VKKMTTAVKRPKKKGMAWHVHHDKLLEYCYDYDERVKFIKSNKFRGEIAVRLRRFRLVKGNLPEAVIKAEAAREKAKATYNKARAGRNKVWAVYCKAYEASCKALYDNMSAILALHAKECPDCPWDGRTLFSRKNKNQ
jgi:hypothetical protein